jgi:transcription antitermination factor NusG
MKYTEAIRIKRGQRIRFKKDDFVGEVGDIQKIQQEYNPYHKQLLKKYVIFTIDNPHGGLLSFTHKQAATT